ncbi:MAG: AAA family ATPase [Terriglobales bacterium]
MITAITVRNLLSFGPETPELHLKRLNVLIGPNGSGKSNLIEILGLLHQAPFKIRHPISAGGGIAAWIWKGGNGADKRSGANRSRIGHVEVVVSPEYSKPLRYKIELRQPSRAIGQMEIASESLETAEPYETYTTPYIYYEANGARALINPKGEAAPRKLQTEEIDLAESILSQRKDPERYPEITYIGKHFDGMRFYRDWSTGINAEPRRVQAPGAQGDYLEEDTSNLSLVINRLLADVDAREKLITNLRDFYPGAKEVTTLIQEGAVSLQLLEEGGFTTPGARLSDGTLRWLCLLAVLLNPQQHSVVAIEEPELGLHPDIMRTLAKLLREASKRAQVFVTTHSEALVDALSDEPESVIVCEKPGSETELRRLCKDELSCWLEKYSLGELWRNGEIGGSRW